MRLTSAFLVGVLFGGGFGLIAASIAWDMHCMTHRRETRELLIERMKTQETIALLERQGAAPKRRGK